MADDIHVRDATLGEVAVIADFNIAMARETEDLALDPGTILAGVRAVLDDASKGSYYVAEMAGDVVGVLMITYEWSDWRNGLYLWIQSVYVQPECRCRGVFRALYRHVERLAGRDGRLGLRLYAHVHNEQAVATYERLGMQHYGYQLFETPDVLREDQKN